MPNWVTTVIKFDGEQEDINNVFAKIGNSDADNENGSIFDFNKLIPMPESLNVTSGSESENAYAYYMAKKFNRLPSGSFIRDTQEAIDRVEKNLDVSSQKALELGRQLAENIEKYGAKDWFDWCCIYWGTKWNASSCCRQNNQLSFQTAWSWPMPIIEKLAEICANHNVCFHGRWADEDCGVDTGEFSSTDEGELYPEYYPDCSDDAYAAYIECHGETPCIGKNDGGNYIRYSCDENCPNTSLCGYI